MPMFACLLYTGISEKERKKKRETKVGDYNSVCRRDNLLIFVGSAKGKSFKRIVCYVQQATYFRHSCCYL